MAKHMLIDATHPEETRVVVVSGTRLEELDVETSTKKQLKGNIYLAKIIRVEPSLQAAFVEYGGNRHGFLAFSEIHPDYYQIPVADRQRLLAEERAVFNRSHEADNNGSDTGEAPAEGMSGEGGSGDGTSGEEASEDGTAGDGAPGAGLIVEGPSGESGRGVDVVGGDDDDMERRRPRPLRSYKIQDVIKRRQIILVQVVKEERGNKGAALTTYLSLAGRYCVLMPNTARGGGVSRKIVNLVDRKRLKAIASELEIPDGMAVIVRTAGSERTKAEIKRDYEYLLRLWDNIRELTLRSVAPALTYEEANLIKRAIRDLYSRDIEDILVDGEEGYRAAKDFMRMLTPSHAKRVQPYRDTTMPLFYRFQIESQLDAMHSPVVQLKSGGYIVINQTEALVAIDVNSGRATKERHIEETAVKTNLEASDEIARQLRLRDLAGLIVIDFIDMEENRNNYAVERRLKEAMKNDRARIQLGRISPFGLLELSRQRLRPSLQETTFLPCQHCGGTGQVRSVESAAVYVLRAIEEEGIRRRSSEITVTASSSVALYILNQKRSALAEIESAYAFRVYLTGDDSLIPPAYRIDRVRAEFRPEEAPRPIEVQPSAPPIPVVATIAAPEEPDEEEEIVEAVETPEAPRPSDGSGGEDQPRRKRRRRKRRKRGDEAAIASGQPGEESEGDDIEEEGSGGDGSGGEVSSGTGADAEEAEGSGDDDGEETEETLVDESGEQPRKRRRGKRGGRRRRREGGEGDDIAAAVTSDSVVIAEQPMAEIVAVDAGGETVEIPAPTEKKTSESSITAEPVESSVVTEAVEAPVAAEAVESSVTAEPVVTEPLAEEPVAETPAKKPRARRKTKAEAAAEAAVEAGAGDKAAEAVAEPVKKPRSRKAASSEKTAEKAPAKPTKKAAAKAPAKETPTKEPKAPSRRRKKADAAEAEITTAPVEAETVEAETIEVVEASSPEVVARSEETANQPAVEEAPAAAPVITALPEDAAPRRGWWRR